MSKSESLHHMKPELRRLLHRKLAANPELFN